MPRTRKENADEIIGFVQALYAEAITLDTGMELIDTCGTGGDGLNTFNISTTAALVAASCGIPVAKHGNSAVTGRVGSADVLEALGVNIRMQPAQAQRLLEKTGISFFFALSPGSKNWSVTPPVRCSHFQFWVRLNPANQSPGDRHL